MPYKKAFLVSTRRDYHASERPTSRARVVLAHDKAPLVLLVEDNPAHAELVQRGFADLEFRSRVYHVGDGKQALNYLFHQDPFANVATSPRPKLILLDLRLPRVSGLSVLGQIKTDNALSSIPVVVLTTSDARRDIDQAYARGTNGYTVKPNDFAQFMQLMGDLSAYWLGRNRVPVA